MLGKLFVVAAVSTVLVLPAWAQTADDLHGTWTLASSVADKNGKKTEQFGHGAKGMMSLDADGHFMLTIIGPDLPKFAANSRAGGTAEENKAVMSKSIAMIGSYSVNPADKTLTFKVESATFPNWNGTAQKRLIVTASKTELKYITPTASSGGVGTVTWTRAR
jgi:Lipocalin-like domain